MKVVSKFKRFFKDFDEKILKSENHKEKPLIDFKGQRSENKWIYN